MVGAGGVQVLVAARQWPAALALRGPGQLGREGAEGVLIFDAGQGGRRLDPLVRFYDEEITALDWLEDYLRDVATTNLVRDLQDPPDDDAEVEEVFLTKMVLNPGIDEL
jgi:hypothetical protein